MGYLTLTPRTIVLSLALALVCVVVLACGPADESVQEQLGNAPYIAQDDSGSPTPEPTTEPTSAPEPTAEPTQEPTPTLEPECSRTEGSYTLLDDTLKDMVQKYETCELEEEEAAALADLHEGPRVVVTVDLTTNGDTTVLEQMGKQEIEPRFQVQETDPDFIYAYVKVSALGELSQLQGLTKVRETENFLPSGSTWENPQSPYAPRTYRDGTSIPELPWWLKGYRHEGTYPKITGLLNGYYRMYRKGELTEAIKNEGRSKCMFSGDSVNVTILAEDSFFPAIRTYLSDNALTIVDNSVAKEKGVTHFGASVPLSLLADLIGQDGLLSIDGNGCPFRDASEDEYYNSQSSYKGPDEILGADAWHDRGGVDYEGDGVKVGIIDSGFRSYMNLEDDELPATSDIHTYCFANATETTATGTASDCNADGSRHGATVAESIMQVAPEVELYISNASEANDSMDDRLRLRSAVEWAGSAAPCRETDCPSGKSAGRPWNSR